MAKKIRISPSWSREDATQHILANYTMYEIVDMLIDYIKIENETAVEEKPIVVSKSEMDRILRLFRAKGDRYGADGCLMEETRGRKKKQD